MNFLIQVPETIVHVFDSGGEQVEPFLKGILAINPPILYVFKSIRQNLLLLEVFQYYIMIYQPLIYLTLL